MEGRVGVGGGDAHEAGDFLAEAALAGGDEGVGFGGRDAGFLGFVADIDLDEQVGEAAGFLRGGIERVGEAEAIEAFDDVGEADGVFGLVGLQGADEVQAQAGGGFAQAGEFAGGFLDAVFAEDELAGGDGGADGLDRVGFGDCHQRDLPGSAAGVLCGEGDAGADDAEGLLKSAVVHVSEAAGRRACGQARHRGLRSGVRF